jgi:hypothetical protein
MTPLVARLLARWRRELATPTDPGEPGLVTVRFKRKHWTSTGLFNMGEVASFPASYAAGLVAAGLAKRVRPDAVSRVSPRPDPAPPADDGAQEIATACRRVGAWFPVDPLLDDPALVTTTPNP